MSDFRPVNDGEEDEQSDTFWSWVIFGVLAATFVLSTLASQQPIVIQSKQLEPAAAVPVPLADEPTEEKRP